MQSLLHKLMQDAFDIDLDLLDSKNSDRNSLVSESSRFYLDEEGQPHSTDDDPGQLTAYPSTLGWYSNGQVHRDDGPAWVTSEGWVPKIEEWYSRGLRHRDDGPAVVRNDLGHEEKTEYWHDGILSDTEEPKPGGVYNGLLIPKSSPPTDDYTGWWDDELGSYYFGGGVVDSAGDQPAVILYDGTQIWVKQGYIHRDDNPAVALTTPQGSLSMWFQNGLVYRDSTDGPAIVIQSELPFDRAVIFEAFVERGLYHSDADPAFIWNQVGPDGKLSISKVFKRGAGRLPNHDPAGWNSCGYSDRGKPLEVPQLFLYEKNDHIISSMTRVQFMLEKMRHDLHLL